MNVWDVALVQQPVVWMQFMKKREDITLTKKNALAAALVLMYAR
jgi:hypothetical protein